MFAVFWVRAQTLFATTKKCALKMEDPGTTNNYVTHTFEEGMNFPSRPLALSLKVLGNKMFNLVKLV